MTKDFEIRFARTNDRNMIMSFIKSYWSANHILAHDQNFFDFQHLENERLSFVLGLDFKGKLSGILGYISYDYAEDNQDIALALWKVIPNLADPYLGVKLIHYLQDNINTRNIHCVGINKKILGIYKYLGFKTGKLDHYAAFNKGCKKFKIAVPPSKIKDINQIKKFKFIKTPSIEPLLDKLYTFEFYKKKVPYKSRDFFIKRYDQHPYFHYIFHEVILRDIFQGFVVSRAVEHQGSHALRIIEVVSQDKLISDIINNFANIINDSAYEYVDVYASGLNNQILATKNFENIFDSEDIIVPDYFQPFEKKNIDIYYMTSGEEGTILFKGDGDQDRPNI
tara:strand:- start:1726 stop:2736 length:1011 start_codon:yes stop_codon:yes gene_type:complete